MPIDILNAIRGRNMGTWIYVFDEFRRVNIDKDELVRLVKEDPAKLFNRVRDALDVGKVENVSVYDIHFDTQSNELLVEYIVRCGFGEVSVKVIHSQDPVATLKKYYEYEKSSR